VELRGVISRDWEDISGGPGGVIYVFDGGDNPPTDRTDKAIHRVLEPSELPVDLLLEPGLVDSIRFQYPDDSDPSRPADSDGERYDAEYLFVHPVNGDLCIVTKRSEENIAVARVYKLAASAIAWNSDEVHVLEFVGDITSRAGSMITAGDMDADGCRIVIRNYTTAFECALPEARTFEEIFLQAPMPISLFGELQGEGIYYAADGGDIITTSEVRPIGPERMPVFVAPW